MCLGGSLRPLSRDVCPIPCIPPISHRLTLLLLLLTVFVSRLITLPPATLFVFRRLLNKLDAAISTSPFLENITLVDTPGVLSGEMQMHQRAYNFADVSLDCLRLVVWWTSPLVPIDAAYPLSYTLHSYKWHKLLAEFKRVLDAKVPPLPTSPHPTPS